jgi:hypothetical protein
VEDHEEVCDEHVLENINDEEMVQEDVDDDFAVIPQEDQQGTLTRVGDGGTRCLTLSRVGDGGTRRGW